ncbi:MAG: DUF3465 domain-containing protein [Gammaproteobacteria bacterium]|nr:DUF3465 domain-containing protein [Gammaproteobacteria bacterium]
MKPFLHLIAAALAAAYIYSQNLPLDWFSVRAQSTPATLHQAFDQSLSNIQIADEGIVIKILDDDLKGSRHQRFILKLAHGQTVLIAHNIDLSERIQGLKKGDHVAFYGEYEWNPKGGVIHWTHRDPARRHIGGWLKHQGNTYQ